MGASNADYERQFKEIVAKAKAVYGTGAYDDSTLEFLIPGLRESEDERVIKALETFINQPEIADKITFEARILWLSWLEKQKERKHPNGCFTCDEYKKGYEEGRRNGFTAGYNKAMKEQKPLETPSPSVIYTEQGDVLAEQKPANDTAFEKWLDDWYQGSKEAGGDVVMSEAEFKNWSRGIKNMYQQKPAEWSEVDENKRQRIIKVIEAADSDWVLQKAYGPYGDLINWLKSLHPSQKLNEEEIKKIRSEEYTKGFNDAAFGGKLKEWSEEDEQTTKNTHPEEYPSSPAECISPREYGLFKQLQQDCIETIEQELYSLGKEHEKDYDPRIKFLKSLRPQPHWKPSEEQMSMLLAVIRDPNNAGSESCSLALKSIYEQLKKLM